MPFYLSLVALLSILSFSTAAPVETVAIAANVVARGQPKYPTPYHTRTKTTATPTTCVTTAIQSNINAWQTDIADVNAFLNTATQLSPSAVSSQAAVLQRNCPGDAGDEPNHLKALTPCGAPEDASLVATLGQVFPGVLGNLSIITESPSDADIVECAIQAIDYLRCNTVLPDIQGLFDDVVLNYPSPTNIIVSGPNVCPLPFDGSYPSPTGFNLHSCGPTATTTARSCTRTK